MKYSKLFGKTVKTTSSQDKIISSQLLFKAGFIRESTSGRYYMLPLGMRVHQKIMHIIKDAMDRAGAQEMVTPIFHPLSLWEETNRDHTAKFEPTILTDKRGVQFVPGGTAEEMFVDLVRKYQLSYKDLPFNIYQFSNKFRDELRSRGGLLRVREFIMKDAYSFHADEKDFKQEYKKMGETYTHIFERLGLKTIMVESDNGYIGGEYCHEFVVESEIGESRFLVTEDGSYAAHEDVAKFILENVSSDEQLKPMEDVLGKGIIGVEELAKFLKIPVEKTTKTILFETDKGKVIAAAVRGGFDINEVKLIHIIGCNGLKLASAETVKKVTGAEVGYTSVLNLPKEVKVYFDESMFGRKNFETGANRTNYHTINVNFGRDLPEPKEFYDFKLAKEGYISPDGQKLIAKRGIEVGNIFQLGFHYSSKMKGANFRDSDGKQKPYYMGCYGIGLGRTLATIVEVYNDDKGIIWPEAVAPYQVHIVGLDGLGEKEYKHLLAEGVETLFDDRLNLSAGEKFADADLIGIPYRVVVSKRTEDKLEVKKRSEKQTRFLALQSLLEMLKS